MQNILLGISVLWYGCNNFPDTHTHTQLKKIKIQLVIILPNIKVNHVKMVDFIFFETVNPELKECFLFIKF